jgi:hypothetical protein
MKALLFGFQFLLSSLAVQGAVEIYTPQTTDPSEAGGG